MEDVVMKKEDNDNLSVKELDVVLPRYQEFHGSGPSSNYAGVCELFPQEQLPIKEAEAELENLHLDCDAFLPVDSMISPSLIVDSRHDYLSVYPQYFPEIKDVSPEELERCMIEFTELKAAAAPHQPVPDYESISPSIFDFLPPSLIEYRRFDALTYIPCETTFSPTPPGGYNYPRSQDIIHAEPLLLAEIALHCYNFENGTHFERLGLPRSYDQAFEARDPVSNYTCKFETNVRVATRNKDCFHVITTRCRPFPPPPPPPPDKDGFDTLCVDELFKGNLPDWLPDDYATSTLLMQYYEMKESEVEQAKEWLHLYAELALFTQIRHLQEEFYDSKPLELGKVIVQTRGTVDFMKLDNAVFFITFKTSGGGVCKGIIRRTRDGIQEHLSLEAKCFM